MRAEVPVQAHDETCEILHLARRLASKAFRAISERREKELGWFVSRFHAPIDTRISTILCQENLHAFGEQ